MAETRKPSKSGGILEVLANITIFTILVGILIFLGLVSLIVLGVSVRDHIDAQGDQPYPSMCEDAECLRHAGITVRMMNYSVDPCYDMYEFACGNFKNSYQLPRGVESLDLMASLQVRCVRLVE